MGLAAGIRADSGGLGSEVSVGMAAWDRRGTGWGRLDGSGAIWRLLWHVAWSGAAVEVGCRLFMVLVLCLTLELGPCV